MGNVESNYEFQSEISKPQNRIAFLEVPLISEIFHYNLNEPNSVFHVHGNLSKNCKTDGQVSRVETSRN